MNGRRRPSSTKIREWAEHKGGILKAGIDLFHHFHRHAHGTVNFIAASPLMSRVLLRAADKALSGPLPTRRRADIGMFHYRISKGNLAWNADKKVFESCPAPEFRSKKVNHELGPIDVSARTEGAIWRPCKVMYKPLKKNGTVSKPCQNPMFGSEWGC